jgi:hypothetical protein
MKWLEIIEIRSTDTPRERFENILQDLIKDVEGESHQHNIRVFFRKSIDSDYSIHLFHDSIIEEGDYCELGVQLSSALLDFGFVHHSVWSELKTN